MPAFVSDATCFSQCASGCIASLQLIFNGSRNSKVVDNSHSGPTSEAHTNNKKVTQNEEAPPLEPNKEEVPEVLSKNQQKKIAKRDAKKKLEGQMRLQKQAEALANTLSVLHELLGSLPPLRSNDTISDIVRVEEIQQQGLAEKMLETFGVECSYRNLTHAHGPSPTEGLSLLGSVLVRPPKHQAKFLPQEYSLLHKMWCLLGGDCRRAGVIDIGAGNALCGVLAAIYLGLTVICVERESPRVELRAEAQLPPHLQSRIVRLECDVEDFDAAALAVVASQHGFDRVVLVAKHPCGIGVDRSIECTSQLLASSVDVVGVVMATCCTNKLSCDDFKISRVPEFCGLYNKHACRDETVSKETASTSFERTIELMSRCSAWRTAAGSFCNAIHDDQLRWAEYFEDAVQHLRLQRLRELFGSAVQLRFAPSACTLQDRCLIAGGKPLPPGIWAHGDNSKDCAFIEQLRSAAQVVLAECGPIDCRPKGIRSERYGFDTTNGTSDIEPLDD